jgi:Ni,Fe-hydrogenase I large subunit
MRIQTNTDNLEKLKKVENKIDEYEQEIEFLKKEDIEIREKLYEKYLKYQELLTQQMIKLDLITDESLKNTRKEQITRLHKLLKPIDKRVKEYKEE